LTSAGKRNKTALQERGIKQHYSHAVFVVGGLQARGIKQSCSHAVFVVAWL